MKKTVLIAVMLMLVSILFVGCNESQKIEQIEPVDPNIIPFEKQLLPTRQDWKDAYGDTKEVQIAYNFAVMRGNDLKIAEYIKGLHFPTDPNALTLERLNDKFEAKFKALEESNKVDPNEPTLESRIEALEELEEQRYIILSEEDIEDYEYFKGCNTSELTFADIVSENDGKSSSTFPDIVYEDDGKSDLTFPVDVVKGMVRWNDGNKKEFLEIYIDGEWIRL